MGILVFGSLNMDLVAQVSRLPLPGETLAGDRFTTSPGGKGANQAVAAAKLGADTTLIGRVGTDGFGRELVAHLQGCGVNGEAIATDPSTSTGIAQILVDGAGQNQIVIVGGANHTVGEDELRQLEAYLPQTQLLLLQLEIPLDSVIAAAQLAKAAGVTTILDPAPAPEQLPESLYQAVDILTPNETEASRLVGFPVKDLESAAIAAETLKRRGTETVIITLGDRGVFCASTLEYFGISALPVDVVDTVAAGDAFNGALAVALLENSPSLFDAIQWATCAGAITCTQPGAQSSLPDRPAVEQAYSRIVSSPKA